VIARVIAVATFSIAMTGWKMGHSALGTVIAGAIIVHGVGRALGAVKEEVKRNNEMNHSSQV